MKLFGNEKTALELNSPISLPSPLNLGDEILYKGLGL